MSEPGREPSIEANRGAGARRVRAIVLGLVVLLALAYTIHRQKSRTAMGGAIHAIAPDFSLADLNGQTLSLAQFRGKVVLLNFWATWCEPCRAEIPELVKLQNSYRQPGLQIVGISMDDDAKEVHPFYDQFHMNYPVAVGDAHLADRFGGILGLPVSFIIGCDGRIEARFIGALNFPNAEGQIKSLLQDHACSSQRT